ncbi:RrF2 family transcriptional regulator [Paenibacillus protaetiae]|uniref:Rrf2 family transcriptional regulator n=1 Tax=Paenibacillus protaetiae TaxID=2509456 RepID=A0A4P6EXM5_9BACL|nr:Rrf2 family transcriptional regulator [Paenibacillus protaetiae]QAY68160.1 Rrf2 family transcriptional regulator [Paenibacillus protaetiae]
MREEKCTSPRNHKWFGLSLQALVVLSHKTCAVSSSEIAPKLCSEATLLRRVLAKLAKAGIVSTREGRDGGYRLSRPADSITLAEVYLAMRVGQPLSSGMLDTTGVSAFGQEMKSAFIDITNELEQMTIEVLSHYTIAQLASRICEEKMSMLKDAPAAALITLNHNESDVS